MKKIVRRDKSIERKSVRKSHQHDRYLKESQGSRLLQNEI